LSDATLTFQRPGLVSATLFDDRPSEAERVKVSR
jgi:hypothetical protein